MTKPAVTGIDLYWLPLGAGGHSVRPNGKVFEAVAASVGRRDRCDLYHSALQVCLTDRTQRTGGSGDPTANGRTGSRVAGRHRHRMPTASRGKPDSEPLGRSGTQGRAASFQGGDVR